MPTLVSWIDGKFKSCPEYLWQNGSVNVCDTSEQNFATSHLALVSSNRGKSGTVEKLGVSAFQRCHSCRESSSPTRDTKSRSFAPNKFGLSQTLLDGLATVRRFPCPGTVTDGCETLTGCPGPKLSTCVTLKSRTQVAQVANSVCW